MKDKYVLIVIVAIIFSACTKAEYAAPDLGGLYNRAATRSHEAGSAVIVIPGMLGSKLRDSETGQLVWGAYEKGTTDPRRPPKGRDSLRCR